MSRPPVSVICPVGGSQAEVTAALDRLETIERSAEDEIIVVHNALDASTWGAVGEGRRVLAASRELSSYYARNVGADAAGRAWLLFLDADCLPSPAILDEYFAEPIPAECGAVAGGVWAVPEQPGVLARYARNRGILDQAVALSHPFRPYGATANLLVRKAAWLDLRGFCAGIRSGGDADFCWRLQQKGWQLRSRPEAFVHHQHRDRLAGLVEQFARYGAGAAWLRRRHPEVPPRRWALALAHSVVGMCASLPRLRFEEATFKALDAASVLRDFVGAQRGNRATMPHVDSAVAVVTTIYPDPASVGLVATLENSHGQIHIEAARRPPLQGGFDSTVVSRPFYAEDDSRFERLNSVLWLIAHPSRKGEKPLAKIARRRSAVLPASRRLAEAGVQEIYTSDGTSAVSAVNVLGGM